MLNPRVTPIGHNGASPYAPMSSTPHNIAAGLVSTGFAPFDPWPVDRTHSAPSIAPPVKVTRA